MPPQQNLSNREFLNSLRDECYGIAVERGWYTDPSTGEAITPDIGTRFALMHSEISEAFESWRRFGFDEIDQKTGLPNVGIELADEIIRILDFCGHHNIDIGAAVEAKCAYNKVREDHDIKKRMNKGGKRV